jgi:2-phosphosulfolactate phosphatase
MYFDQAEYDVRFEWGLSGIQALAPISDVVIVIDVLSFATCVEIAVTNGAAVFPYGGPAHELATFAAQRDAIFASPGRQQTRGFSLSPASLLAIEPGTRLVLPSPNGSTLSLSTGGTPTLAGCLRNARAVASRAVAFGRRIGVIAAGERWPDASLRPALEDLIGAGAIMAHLPGRRSPEAELALNGFVSNAACLGDTVARCGSGQELLERGFVQDVTLASELNVSETAPILTQGAYRRG